ncbi:MAG: SUMF1/EgtB/PvdO family nonheme iron enzyme [Verrucomicrobia bacterium]|nr:SUMF1/EgtB/PvdO family nonheme iron enzyme [Verrucomicrobiota bacterium]
MRTSPLIAAIAFAALLPASRAAEVDFVKQIQPLLELNCVACHREGYAKANYRMDTREEALKPGESGTAIKPGDASKSSVYTRTILPADNDELMPPKAKGGPLPKEQTDLIRDWINQGAKWPAGVVLTAKKIEVVQAVEEKEVVAGIYKLITSRKGEPTSAKAMKIYTNTIPGTDVSFVMMPIPAGEFTMGSPDSEKGRKPDEGPQHKVKISPFWMGQCEITWNEFELFMYADEERKFKDKLKTDAKVDRVSDIVARPTKPYVEMSFGMGKDGYPAISMTQHAANKYCEWLSAKTGQFHRLPTEAEWEYAARAGTTTAYSWGDDLAKAKEYAWFEANSDFKYQKVGKKKPNPWGLYDMHGNVAEWVLDQHEADYKNVLKTAQDPWAKQTAPYGQSVRGGSWDDTLDKLRSSARRFSDKSWKQQDPQLPKSIWYLTDAQFLGFRVVRPLKVPTAAEMQRYWNNGVEHE